MEIIYRRVKRASGVASQSVYEGSGWSTPTSATIRTTMSSYQSTVSTINPLFYSYACDTATNMQLFEATCVPKTYVQMYTVNLLRTRLSDNTAVANALSLYITSINNANTTLNSTYTLSLGEIDAFLIGINNQSFMRNTNDSFLMAQPPKQSNNVSVLGASFTRGTGGQVVKNTNKDDILSSRLSTAAIVRDQDLAGVTTLNMLIIDEPFTYRYIDNSTNKTLASSIVVASVQRNYLPSTSINISLYFQIIDQWKPNTTDVLYLCSFYDTNTLQWNESGCTAPLYNDRFSRYECSCNHLTSFALLWLPNVPLTRNLSAQDIASLVFESFSILCFIIVIAHAIFIRLRDPLIGLQTYDLLPLISTASTTILFIFHIALGTTVYTRTTSEQQTQCFLSASVLMFLVYFFLIFMFCAKTSVGYFNYLRFVRLFPQPSYRRLFILLIISFFISIGWVACAIGFNSNSSFQITQLYPYKLCWFTRGVIYYFLTIPVCLFVLINIIVFIVVSVHIIKHVRNATSTHQSHERMRRCVLVLLSSCLTQGIGWLFGPFLTFVNPTAGEVLGWFFVVFNGLEGFFSVVIYILIRLKRMDEQKRVIAARDMSVQKSSKTDLDKASYKDVARNGYERQLIDVHNHKIQKQMAYPSDGYHNLGSLSWPVNGNNERITSSF